MNYIIETSPLDCLEEIKEYTLTVGKIGLDVETSGLRPFQHKLHLISLGDEHKQWVINFHTFKGDYAPLKYVLEDRNIEKVGHNIGFDAFWLKKNLGCDVLNVFCTLTAEKIIRGGQWLGDSEDTAGHGLTNYSLDKTLKRWHLSEGLDKNLTKQFIDYEGTEFSDELLQYACDDIKYLLPLQALQLEKASSFELEEVLAMEKRFTEVLVDIQYNGVAFDWRKWLTLYEENKTYAEKLSKLLVKKHPINWGSPKQVLEIFKADNIPLGDTDSNNIRYYLRDNKVNKATRTMLERVLEYRLYKKRSTTYGANIVHSIDGDNRIRGNFNQLLATGRMSSMQPNLQNIPHEPIYRECFTATPGYKLVGADYASQELVILATLSGEQLWLDAIEQGKDLHSMSAELVFGDEWQKGGSVNCEYNFSGTKCNCPDHKLLRDKAKTLTFGLSYGLTPKTFGLRMGMSKVSAEKLYNRYFLTFKKVAHYLEKAAETTSRTGECYTMEPFNRWRYVRGYEDYRRRNIGKNTPIQGTAGDMMKLAAIKVYNHIHDSDLGDAKILLLVHDEILIEIPDRWDAEQWCYLVKNCMEEAATDILGHNLLKAEPTISDYWIKD